MPDIRITNCHIHTFTSRHVPINYPHPALRIFKRMPFLLRFFAFALRLIGQHPLAETATRIYRFQSEGDKWRQAEVLSAVLPQYPGNTRFVVLPMDMAPAGHGRVRSDLPDQHDELAALAVDPKFAGRVIPFATIHPDRPEGFDEVRRCVEGIDVNGVKVRFRGVKLYPRLGFAPDHPVLMQQLYPYCVEHNLPVMTHCSRGGVRGRGVVMAKADRCTDPASYIPVFEAFPTLRVCLAHFGGSADWKTYVQDGIDPDDPEARPRNWQVAIRDMIGSGKYPGLWTDISYTLFDVANYLPFLKLFLEEEALARRVLFGSDSYMTRQEQMSERSVCFHLRAALGEPVFRRIAEENPEIWLGERPERSPPPAK